MTVTRKALFAAALLALAGAGPLTPTASVDEVLDALDVRKADLQSFSADLKQTQQNLQAGSKVVYSGHATFQFRPDGDARMALVLDTKQKQDAPPVPNKKEYLLDGGWVTDRDHPLKNEVRRQVAPAGEKVNLFQLGKGAIPLPIGQDKRQVYAQFTVKKEPAANDDPPRTVHLSLVPKAGTSLARQFSSLDFWVDLGQRLPVKIETVNAHQTEAQTNELSNLTVNRPVNDAAFTLAPLPPNWKTHDEPLRPGQ